MTWEWTDLRYFLAVARAGTTSAAARTLGVNQTTCARRIEALERDLGLTLFQRTRKGYRITEAGASLVPEAERAEAGALRFQQLAADHARSARGMVRLTTGDLLAELIAVPAIEALAQVRPELRVELEVSSYTADLASGAADVALRAALAIEEPALVARKIMNSDWAFYCSRDYAARHGTPANMEQAAAHPLLMLAGTPTDLLLAQHPSANIRHGTNSMVALVNALADGRGVGALPAIAAERRAELVRCFDVPFDTGGVWIVYHERLRHVRHVRLLVDYLARFAAERVIRPTGAPGSLNRVNARAI